MEYDDHEVTSGQRVIFDRVVESRTDTVVWRLPPGREPCGPVMACPCLLLVCGRDVCVGCTCYCDAASLAIYSVLYEYMNGSICNARAISAVCNGSMVAFGSDRLRVTVIITQTDEDQGLRSGRWSVAQRGPNCPVPLV